MPTLKLYWVHPEQKKKKSKRQIGITKTKIIGI